MASGVLEGGRSGSAAVGCLRRGRGDCVKKGQSELREKGRQYSTDLTKSTHILYLQE